MADFIEREQAVTVFKTFYGRPLRIMLEALAEEHAADVRPVVLCRDCKHYELDNGWCEYFDTDRVFEDYCSEGEKREER